MNSSDLKSELKKHASPEKAKASAWFFKTGPGQYGEGDQFIGVTLPEQRIVAREFKDLPLSEVEKLIQSPVHEERLTALIILVSQYKKADPATKKAIASFYHKKRAYVNNWDLVDSSAPYILGDYLINRSRAVLYRLAKSKSMWDRRIAVISTFAFINKGETKDSLAICEILLNDKEDLIHKAVGWTLREVGKRVSKGELVAFLKKNYQRLPRTALRYAIEHFPPEVRAKYLKGDF